MINAFTGLFCMFYPLHFMLIHYLQVHAAGTQIEQDRQEIQVLV